MIKFISLLPLIFFLSACTYLVESIKVEPIQLKNVEPKICHLKDQYLFIGESKELIKVFHEKIGRLKLNQKEIIYAWAMANTPLMPDMVNEMSFGGVFLINKAHQKIEFLDQKDFSSNVNKKKISHLLNTHIPQKLKTGKLLAKKLRMFSKQQPNKKLPKKYMIAQQTIGEKEFFMRDKYRVKNIFNTKGQSPLPFKAESNVFDCLGFDSKKKTGTSETATLSIVHQDWHAIIVFSNKMSDQFERPHFAAPNISVCKTKSNSYQNTYISYEDKNHRALMRNLIRLGLYNIDNIEDLIYYITYPRFILHKNENYIHLESLRADKTLESYLNTLNIPIYHKNNIGKIQSIYSFNKNVQTGFLIDSREPIILKCL